LPDLIPGERGGKVLTGNPRGRLDDDPVILATVPGLLFSRPTNARIAMSFAGLEAQQLTKEFLEQVAELRVLDVLRREVVEPHAPPESIKPRSPAPSPADRAARSP